MHCLFVFADRILMAAKETLQLGEAVYGILHQRLELRLDWRTEGDEGQHG
jgi:hypothetical protein